ncbi:acyl-CoA dehydrogenase family protein [Rhodococcoides yunnanense]|uniref:acyl-CoA dehydrogenase family protein n=1 Tax=Rhodococcoides yunnanense TaxID=278209 RepID=UPI0009336093|nr:acyl-CoA dehydrogenase family protein [Rhodococcus yunnanensis]
MTSVADPATRFDDLFAEIASGAAERERTRDHPFDAVRALNEAGFGRLRVPAEFGGPDVSLKALFDQLAALGEADSNLPQVLRGHFTTVEILRHLADSPERRYWLEKIAAGAVFGNAQSEPASAAGFVLSTTLTGDIGAQTVSGRKDYSTGSIYADFIRVAAAEPDGRRTFAVVDARHPGVHHLDDWDGIGQRLTGSGTTEFDAVPVEPHGTFATGGIAGGFQSAFTQLVHQANLTGIARNIVSDAVTLVRSRQRTSLHALSEHATEDAAVLGVVGQIKVHARVAESLLHSAVAELQHADDLFEAGDRSEDLFTAAYIATSEAQIATIDAVGASATRLFDAGGSSTVREVANFDRHWRNARTLSSHNPVIYKPHVIGDYLVNGRRPKQFHESWGTKGD